MMLRWVRLDASLSLSMTRCEHAPNACSARRGEEKRRSYEEELASSADGVAAAFRGGHRHCSLPDLCPLPECSPRLLRTGLRGLRLCAVQSLFRHPWHNRPHYYSRPLLGACERGTGDCRAAPLPIFFADVT